MTERSFFYDGTTKGDAQEAPYDADTFSLIEGLLHTSNGAYGSPPTVTANGANMNLTVTAGSALVRGRYIVAAGNPITVPSNTSTLPRVDRIVFRVNLTSYQGDVVLKQGAPNYAPIPAEIIQTDEIYEMPLYRIYVPSGATVINSGYVVDEREFYSILVPGSTQWDHSENIMFNSEFMAGAGTGTISGAGNAPAMWSDATGTTTIETTDKFEQMPRGSGIKVTCPSLGDGLSTTVSRLANNNTVYYTLRLLINVLEGIVNINTGGGGGSAIIPPTNGPTEVIIRRTFTAADPSMELTITNSGSVQATFILGQVTLSQGYTGAAFLPQKELILFTSPIIPDSFNPYSGLNPAFGVNVLLNNLVGGNASPICDGISALLLRVIVSNPSSAGGSSQWTGIEDINGAYNTYQLRLEYGRSPNNYQNILQGLVGIPYDTDKEQKYRLSGNSNGVQTIYLSYLGCKT